MQAAPVQFNRDLLGYWYSLYQAMNQQLAKAVAPTHSTILLIQPLPEKLVPVTPI